MLAHGWWVDVWMFNIAGIFNYCVLLLSWVRSYAHQPHCDNRGPRWTKTLCASFSSWETCFALRSMLWTCIAVSSPQKEPIRGWGSKIQLPIIVVSHMFGRVQSGTALTGYGLGRFGAMESTRDRATTGRSWFWPEFHQRNRCLRALEGSFHILHWCCLRSSRHHGHRWAKGDDGNNRNSSEL